MHDRATTTVLALTARNAAEVAGVYRIPPGSGRWGDEYESLLGRDWTRQCVVERVRSGI
jgi:hypothetical protein